VADFIGRANFIETRVEAANGPQVTVTILGKTVALPVRFEARAGDTVVAVMRPEALALRPDPALFQVEVQQRMYLGPSIDYMVNAGDQSLNVAETDPSVAHFFSEGQRLGIDFLPETVHLLPA
jgi:ABC-type Fe3+/spermidine/putrescine transport system ATPase subunit